MNKDITQQSTSPLTGPDIQAYMPQLYLKNNIDNKLIQQTEGSPENIHDYIGVTLYPVVDNDNSYKTSDRYGISFC